MGRVVLGVVGGVVGYFAGGPSGAYYGFAIGYGVGALTEEGPSGPRLSDLRFTSSQYGQPIPWIRGAPRISGSIIWASDKRELSSGGKGGNEGEQYSYEVDVLVLLCDHEAAGVGRIWSNGNLVWNSRVDAPADTVIASDDSNLWRRLQFYRGDDAQLPDPTYEAAVGVGNAPAYRGRSTLMIEGLQLGSSGQLPNLTFEVIERGTFEYADNGFLCQFDNMASAGVVEAEVGGDLTLGTGQALVSSPSMFGNALYLSNVIAATSSTGISLNVDGKHWRIEGWFRCSAASRLFQFFHASTSGQVTIGYRTSLNEIDWNVTNDVLTGGGAVGGASGTYRPALNTWFHVAVQYTLGGRMQVFCNGRFMGNITPIGVPHTGSPFSRVNIGSNIPTGGLEVYVDSLQYRTFSEGEESELYVGNTYGDTYTVPNAPFSVPDYVVQLIVPGEIDLQETVEGLCERAGMPAGTYDASALSAITRPVRSLAVSSGATRGTMEQLATAFFFQCSLRDKLYFRPRGGSVAATIQWADLAASANGNGADDQSLPLNIGNELELPPQVAVSYINVNDDAQAGTEYSDRMTVGQAAVRTLSLGLGMTPAEAKGVADAVVADTAAALLTGAVALPISYARLDPADVVEVVDVDGRSYRLRLERKRDERGVLAFEVAADDPSAIVSQQITDTTQTGAVNVTKPGDTVLQALDVPLLRDADNAPGFYVAAKGSTTNWPGGQALISSNNVDYVFAAEINESAVFGTCTTTLGNYTGIGFDERNSLTVSVGNGELASTTRDAMLADETINALLVGSEIVRFRSASLVSPGVYTVSGLLRGQRGTEWAMAGHVASERCVLLRSRGLRRVTQDAGENGQLRYLRGATLGATPKSTTTQITNTNVGLKPLAPVDIRAEEQSGQNLLLSWRRRSRLSARFLASGGVPLGESSEGYVVRLYAPPSTLRRTITVAGSSSVVYTRAQQIADGFSAGSDIRVDVAQVSAVVGEGYIGTATVRAAAQPLAQITQITLGGTFASGADLYAQLGSTRVDYTTVGGDTDLAGAATSFAAAIDATTDYAASAAGPVITVTGPMSTAYGVEVGNDAGDNTLTFGVTQTASDTVVGVPNEITASWGAIAGFVPAGTIGTLLVRRVSPAFNFSLSGDTFLAGSTTPGALAYLGDGIAAAWAAGGYAATYGLTLVREDASAFRLFTPASQPYNWTVEAYSSEPSHVSASVGNTARGVTPATARPQIIEATFSGTATAGWVYRVTLAGVDFDYTAVGGDDMTNVAAGLAALIDAHADYTASATGHVLQVAHVTNNVPFTYGGRILSSTITVDAAVTQPAA